MKRVLKTMFSLDFDKIAEYNKPKKAADKSSMENSTFSILSERFV